MLKVEEYIKIINDAIKNIPLAKNPKGLYEPIEYTMSFGGKRLRPVLLMMCCDALGGNSAFAVNSAVGLELFHNFTLLHDDVMDKADKRRGMPTVHCRWNENTAILSGDAMLTLATQYITTIIDPAKLKPTLDLFNKTAIEIYEGQQYDVDYESKENVTVDEYLNMIRLKTSVLFGCACRIGAILASASNKVQDAIYNYGVNLGLAFQLQDDYLDVYGNEETFGKEIGGDIVNAKHTFMLISAFADADNKQRNELNRLLALDASTHRNEKIEGVKAIYNSLSIPQKCNDEIQKYFDKAILALNDTKMKGVEKELFTAFAKKLMNRNK
ncbi:MAG: polyprenyl synthetase family protein [Muribaculaceae bacterium]|nr:polyprenyl synthetase family protein [Muribaculaceae bacterium]